MSAEKAGAPKRDLGQNNGSHDSLTHVGSSASTNSREHGEKAKGGAPTSGGLMDKKVTAYLQNPLADKSDDEIRETVDDYVQRTGLHDIKELLMKGAFIAQDRDNFERLAILDETDKAQLRRERTHKWDQTKTLYWTTFMCSMGSSHIFRFTSTHSSRRSI